MMFHCIVAVFANAYTITPSLAGLCGLDPKNQSPWCRKPSSIWIDSVYKLLITSDHSWESECLWSSPPPCRCAAWRLERCTTLLNLSLPQLLLSYWNYGKFLLKCTPKSPHSFTLGFCRNEKPWGIILLFSFGGTCQIYFSYTGLLSEINCKSMLWLCSHHYVQCSTLLAFSSVIPVLPQ